MGLGPKGTCVLMPVVWWAGVGNPRASGCDSSWASGAVWPASGLPVGAGGPCIKMG